jgi:ABC-type transporter Mla MlaB component
MAGRTVAIALHGPLRRSDLPGLAERVARLIERCRPDVAVCELAGVAPDAVALDAIARLRVTAARGGCELRLRDPSRELRELLALSGLAELL